MSEISESPQFGNVSVIRDNAGIQLQLQNNSKDDELLNAVSKNQAPKKIFAKRSSIFSFMGSEDSGKTTESVPKRLPSSSSRISSQNSKITPKFSTSSPSFKSQISGLSKTSSSPFKNSLAKKAEFVKSNNFLWKANSSKVGPHKHSNLRSR